MAVEVIVIYGQGGKGPFSAGFILFKNRLDALGYQVTDHFSWDRPDAVIKYMHDRRKAGVKFVLFGYSLGANCTSWIASAGQPIDLIVAYDPSSGAGPFRAALPNPIGDNVKRCLCYVHTMPEWFGTAPFEGNAEIIKTWAPHGFVQANERLHQMTLRALYDVEVT
jgi:alpha/beta superfamily hydrolase